MTAVPVLLAGGGGRRLGALSTPERPKPFLAPGGGPTLLQRTALRVPSPPYGELRVVLAARNEELARTQLAGIGRTAELLVLEPLARDTCAAAALAVFASGPDELLLLLPTDHDLDADALRSAVEAAEPASRAGRLVAFGVGARGPETRFGYLLATGDGPVREVKRFVEKPDPLTARELLAAGGAFWNAGIYLFRAKTFLHELICLAPAVHAACRHAVREASRRGDALVLPEGPLRTCPAVSLDRAVMERTPRLSLVTLEGEWRDLGVPEAWPKDRTEGTLDQR